MPAYPEATSDRNRALYERHGSRARGAIRRAGALAHVARPGRLGRAPDDGRVADEPAALVIADHGAAGLSEAELAGGPRGGGTASELGTSRVLRTGIERSHANYPA
jgi:hypothetical protein